MHIHAYFVRRFAYLCTFSCLQSLHARCIFISAVQGDASFHKAVALRSDSAEGDGEPAFSQHSGMNNDLFSKK